MKRVFICSPYRGDVPANVALARAACAEVLRAGDAPFAPHLHYPALLDDGDAAERDTGLAAGRAWLAVADEVLVAGPVSDGMRQEIDDALARGIPVRYAQTSQPPRSERSEPAAPWWRYLVPTFADVCLLVAVACFVATLVLAVR
jgi:hypothetical protein